MTPEQKIEVLTSALRTLWNAAEEAWHSTEWADRGPVSSRLSDALDIAESVLKDESERDYRALAEKFLRSKLLRYVPLNSNDPLESDVLALSELLQSINTRNN